MKSTLRYKQKYDFNPLINKAVININDDKSLSIYEEYNVAVIIEKTHEDIVESYVSFISKNLKLSLKAKNMFRYIINEENKTDDIVKMNIESIKTIANYNSLGPIFTGLNELIEHDIIARTFYNDQYFYNPNFIRKQINEIGIFTMLVNNKYKEETKQQVEKQSDDIPNGFNNENKI